MSEEVEYAYQFDCSNCPDPDHRHHNIMPVDKEMASKIESLLENVSPEKYTYLQHPVKIWKRTATRSSWKEAIGTMD